MATDKNMANDNHQDHPHREGPMNNVPSGDAAKGKTNNSQPMSNMLNESEEQKAGRSKEDGNNRTENKQ